jgi:hypothetical protein
MRAASPVLYVVCRSCGRLWTATTYRDDPCHDCLTNEGRAFASRFAAIGYQAAILGVHAQRPGVSQ